MILPITFKDKTFNVQIDEEDYLKWKHLKWCIFKTGNSWKPYTSYKRKLFYMHRVIMQVHDSKIQVDHINRDTLDNRKENLRICNGSQNCYNKPALRRSFRTFNQITYHAMSDYKGIHWNDDKMKWVAQASYQRGHFYLIASSIPEEAAYAYNIATEIIAKQFAYLNIIPENSITEERKVAIKTIVFKKLEKRNIKPIV